jgi:DNA-binding NtrC family response regulator
MANENTILSLNPDGQTLVSHETALRKSGYEVISVSSPLQARFEIEMGRCGVFLTSYITPLAICRDLARLFKSSCPDGLVICITQHLNDLIPDADVLLSDQDQPQCLPQRIQALRRSKAS